MLQAAKIIGLCFTSPPKPHPFPSLPIQSGINPSGII